MEETGTGASPEGLRRLQSRPHAPRSRPVEHQPQVPLRKHPRLAAAELQQPPVTGSRPARPSRRPDRAVGSADSRARRRRRGRAIRRRSRAGCARCREEPGPGARSSIGRSSRTGAGVVPRAQAFAIGVSYPRLALGSRRVARRWPPCRRRWPPTASSAWLGDIRVVEVSHAAGDVHGLVGFAFLRGRSWRSVCLAADVADMQAGGERPDAILGLPLLGPAHPPGSSPQPARTAAQPAAGRHQPRRACADHPARLSQCLDRHRADGRTERRFLAIPSWSSRSVISAGVCSDPPYPSSARMGK